LNFIDFTPIRTSETNMILNGPSGKENGVRPLPVQCIQTPTGQWIVSTWKLHSVADRAEFLRAGEIMIGIKGSMHPPITVVLPKREVPL
jgi:hypothetical protein